MKTIKLGEFDTADSECRKCRGGGWVCEFHPDQVAHQCCGGAGMPCDCNKLSTFEARRENPESPND